MSAPTIAPTVMFVTSKVFRTRGTSPVPVPVAPGAGRAASRPSARSGVPSGTPLAISTSLATRLVARLYDLPVSTLTRLERIA